MELAVVGEFAKEEGLALGVVVAVFLAGLRHGFDIDHIAAISDITSSQRERKRSLLLASLYAVGHMIVLSALGIVAVLAGVSISSSIDSIAGRVIGFTLVVLGLYVMYSLIRFRRDFRMRSRWMLVLAGARRVLYWMRPSNHVEIEHDHEHGHVGAHAHGHRSAMPIEPGTGGVATAVRTKKHTHSHRHVVPMPSDPFTEYSAKTSFFVGMIHGIGAETPTQVLLFTTAAGVAGTLGGLALVAAFVLGLFIGNSVLAIVTTAGFAAGKKLPIVYMGLAAITALLSIYVGVAYLLERGDILPSFLGG